ncbi:MAG: efflux RND transporter periplasmic adaptor subunit [candidate division WOR-3 bacterium]
MKKILIISGIILLLIILIFLNLKTGKKEKFVEIEVVKKGFISESVKTYGTIEAYKQVEISSEVIGKIKKIFFKKGDFVKVGDLLCIIDPSEYETQREKIKLMLEEDLYKLKMARINFEREKNLYEKNLISQKEFENAEANLKAISFKVKEDSFSLKEIENRLSKCYIRSPIDGEVIEVYKKEGEIVIAGTVNNPASVIMIIADRSKMIVKCEIDETEIPKIKRGQRVNIKVDAFPDTIFRGEVARVFGFVSSSFSSNLNRTTETPKFQVEIDMLEKNDFLIPGMSASCEIITAEKDSAITLPYSALGREKAEKIESENREPKTFVFLIKNSKAKKQYVKTGIKGLTRIEIVKGLSVSDTVITGPEDILKKLKDGEKVKIKSEKEKKKSKTK